MAKNSAKSTRSNPFRFRRRHVAISATLFIALPFFAFSYYLLFEVSLPATLHEMRSAEVTADRVRALPPSKVRTRQLATEEWKRVEADLQEDSKPPYGDTDEVGLPVQW